MIFSLMFTYETEINSFLFHSSLLSVVVTLFSNTMHEQSMNNRFSIVIHIAIFFFNAGACDGFTRILNAWLNFF